MNWTFPPLPIGGGSISLAERLDRAAVWCVLLYAFLAPLSISISQAAWVLGLIVLGARAFFRPRPVLPRSLPFWIFLAFVGWTLLSVACSYDVATSAGKLRAISLFTIIPLACHVGRRPGVLRLTLVLLLAGCGVTVVKTLGERAVGRGVRLVELDTRSPLRGMGLEPGDTVLKVDGRRVRSPLPIADALAGGPGNARLEVYRYELDMVLQVPRGKLPAGATAEERLGIRRWGLGREWRAVGFFGHYATYAEVLQLCGSLGIGLLLAFGFRFGSRQGWLALLLPGIGASLFLTVTRAPALALLISACVAAIATRNRRAVLVALLVVALAAPAGMFLLRSKRNVGFVDSSDSSLHYRLLVYHEGWDLLWSSPRHWIVGVGPDSLTTQWSRWGFFDNGRQPVSHLHSTPLQVAVERGLPALALWIAFLVSLGMYLVRALREREGADSWERGLLLGLLGGVTGFFVSGLVHYNLGDSEVIAILYLLVGLCFVAGSQEKTEEVCA